MSRGIGDFQRKEVGRMIKIYASGKVYETKEKCGRCDKVVPPSKQMNTGIEGYMLCVTCYDRLSAYKPIKELFEPQIVIRDRAYGVVPILTKKEECK